MPRLRSFTAAVALLGQLAAGAANAQTSAPAEPDKSTTAPTTSALPAPVPGVRHPVAFALPNEPAGMRQDDITSLFHTLDDAPNGQGSFYVAGMHEDKSIFLQAGDTPVLHGDVAYIDMHGGVTKNGKFSFGAYVVDKNGDLPDGRVIEAMPPHGWPNVSLNPKDYEKGSAEWQWIMLSRAITEKNPRFLVASNCNAGDAAGALRGTGITPAMIASLNQNSDSRTEAVVASVPGQKLWTTALSDPLGNELRANKQGNPQQGAPHLFVLRRAGDWQYAGPSGSLTPGKSDVWTDQGIFVSGSTFSLIAQAAGAGSLEARQWPEQFTVERVEQAQLGDALTRFLYAGTLRSCDKEAIRRFLSVRPNVAVQLNAFQESSEGEGLKGASLHSAFADRIERDGVPGASYEPLDLRAGANLKKSKGFISMGQVGRALAPDPNRHARTDLGACMPSEVLMASLDNRLPLSQPATWVIRPPGQIECAPTRGSLVEKPARWWNRKSARAVGPELQPN